jgi:hypothetical protein
MAGQLTLAYDAGPGLRPGHVPAIPTLIPPLPKGPMRFADLAAMARHIHGLRGARGLQVSALSYASYGDSDTFPGFNLDLIDARTNTTEWIGFVAVQSDSPAGLKAALDATRPLGPAS